MDKTFFINNYISRALKENESFFCISHYKNDISWAEDIKKGNYVIYNKSYSKLKKSINHINIENVGYNLYSYLNFIVNNYESLPRIIVFCKDNIFIKHLKKL